MIQRIQTLYFFLAVSGAAGTLLTPFVIIGLDGEKQGVFSDGIFEAADHLVMQALFAGTGILSLAAIFLYRRRRLQMRLGYAAILLQLVGMLLGGVMVLREDVIRSVEEIGPGLGIFLAVLTVVFDLLAVRHVFKDDQLVKSMDRLR
ncbi:MAG: hypothetical protein RLY31_2700 [Bacteroidota bacterium]|jgi:hypothetical protein